MMPLAHLGAGSSLARAFAPRLPALPLLVGTLLPDLLDKPAYLILKVIAHRQAGSEALFTRGFGHTLLFLAGLVAIALWCRSRPWAALAAGDGTHLLLDIVSKISMRHDFVADNLTVLLWPLRGTHFPTSHYGIGHLPLLLADAVGLALLAWQFGLIRRQPAAADLGSDASRTP